jgi:UDP-glucose 4-epimerase
MTHRILLTGGAGFIGSHTYLALVAAGFDVVILDNFANAHPDVPDRLAQISGQPVQVIRADIQNRAEIEAAFDGQNFDAVVHFAAKKSIPEGEAQPALYYRTNVEGLMNVAEAAVAHQVKAFVFSSSAAVYGNTDAVPIMEDTPLSPENTYARTKAIGEAYLQDLGRVTPGLALGILRYFNPVGAHKSGLIGEDPFQPPTNLVPVIAQVAKGLLPGFKIFGSDYPTADGTGVRDYIHVDDLAQGHVLSLQALLKTGESHLVNLGTGQGHSVLEVLQIYQEVLGRELPYTMAERRPGDAAVSFASVAHARDILGFEAQHKLKEMCASNWAFSGASTSNDTSNRE